MRRVALRAFMPGRPPPSKGNTAPGGRVPAPASYDSGWLDCPASRRPPRHAADSLEGPWKRSSGLNPLDNGLSFIENPVVTKLDNGLYVAVADAGYDSSGLSRPAFGYCWSRDGIHWSKERLCYLKNKAPLWWKWMRTPLCLIRENDSLYTVFHTAYDMNDYGSLGMLSVKLTVDTTGPVKYLDERPVPKYRMAA